MADTRTRPDEFSGPTLKQHGLFFALGMAILTTLGLWRGFPVPLLATTASLALLHLVLALLWPRALGPSRYLIFGLYRVLGVVVTTLLLTVIYYVVATPIALVARLFGKDQITSESKAPAWHDVPERVNDPKHIEKLY